jgi:putative phosphonate metabolism protein
VFSSRFAIYFTPAPGQPLAAFGAAWLGRDVASGEDVTRFTVPALSRERQAEITADARRYGFHATLKPPFALRDGTDSISLEEEAFGFARNHAPIEAPTLCLRDLDGFLALVPSAPCPALEALAASCVETFDPWRALPSDGELERRRSAGLTERHEALLLKWGYPYVMEQFRFHLTLTSRLKAEERSDVMTELAPLVKPLCAEPLTVDAISLLRQVRPDAPFMLVRRFPLGS